MSAPVKRFDLVAARKYNKRDGTEATHWINCGEAVEWDDGSITIKQRTVPVGNWSDGTLRLFERKERDQRPARTGPQHAAQAAPSDDPNDDIPF